MDVRDVVDQWEQGLISFTEMLAVLLEVESKRETERAERELHRSRAEAYREAGKQPY